MVRRPVFFSLAGVALLGVVAALVVLGQDRPEFTTRSSRAWQLYQQGEERLQAFQWSLSDSLLQEAVRLDPGFAMAQAALAYNEALQGAGKARVLARVALADSLARQLPDENERMLVQLRLCDVLKAGNSRRDSLLGILEKRLPRHPLVIIGRATAAQLRGDTEAHEAAWRELLRIDPNHARAYNYLGYAAAQRGRYEEAMAHLRRYAYVAPDLANPHDSLGEVLIWTGDYDAAERELLEALRKQPDFVASIRNLANVYVAQGRLRKADELLAQTRDQLAGTEMQAALDDFTAGLWFHFGHLDRARAAVDRLAGWETAATRKPGRAGVLARLLRLGSAGRAAEAQALCDSLAAATRESPHYRDSEQGRRELEADLHVYQALLYELVGEPTGAMAEWGRALVELAREPPHRRWWLQWRYGESLLRLAQPAEALSQADAILGVNPNLTGPLLMRARCLLELDRRDEARAVLDRLDALLARADRDLPALAAADSLRRRLAPAPSS